MAIQITPAIHPGEILREEYLRPLGLSAYGLAKRLNVPRTRIERLIAETAPITTNTALRLGKFFGTTPQFWMSMQTAFDLTQEGASIAEELEKIETLQAA